MPVPPRPRPEPPRGRFALACALGALVGAGVVAVIAVQIGVGPGTRHYSDDFFDAQARAWLGGHWDVPAGVVGIEGYATDHGMQMYFGAFPALLRLPLLAVTDRLDGQLTVPSMLLAFVVVAVAASHLLWSARSLTAAGKRGGNGRSAHGWFPDALAALTLALVTGASTVTFLAAQPTVYTEAVLWGIALALACADLLVLHLRTGRGSTLVAAAVLAAAAVNTRISTGAGALAAVAVVAVFALPGPAPAGSRRARLGGVLGLDHPAAVGATETGATGDGGGADTPAGPGDAAERPDHRPVGPVRPVGDSRRAAGWALALVALGAVAFAGVNVARFGAPLTIPYAQQVPYRTQPERLAELERTGSLFAPKYVLGNVLTYLRPDGTQLEPAPAVTFLDTADNVRWLTAPPNLFEPTASAPAAMPGLVVLAAVGFVVLVGRARRAEVSPFRVPVAGALLGTLFVFAFASLAHRYTGDLVPLLVLLGVLGTARIGAVTAATARVGAIVGLSATLVWGAWSQVGLTLTIAMRSALHNADALDRWVGVLTDLERRVDGDAVVPRVEAPPRPSGWWQRIADPACDRVYVSYDGSWYAVDHRSGTGAFRLSVTPPPPDGKPRTLVTADDGTVRVGLRDDGGGPTLVVSTDGGATWEAPAGRGGRRADGVDEPQVLPVVDRRIDLHIDVDPFLRRVTAGGDDPDSFAVVRRALDHTPVGAELRPDPGVDVQVVEDPPSRCEEWTRPRD